jgi:hypothetical protein
VVTTAEASEEVVSPDPTAVATISSVSSLEANIDGSACGESLMRSLPERFRHNAEQLEVGRNPLC